MSATNVKKERLSRSKKRVVEEDDEDEEDGAGAINGEEGSGAEEDEDDEHGTPNGRSTYIRFFARGKPLNSSYFSLAERSRTTANGASLKKNRKGQAQTPASDEEEEDAGDGEGIRPSQAVPKPQTLPRGDDG